MEGPSGTPPTPGAGPRKIWAAPTGRSWAGSTRTLASSYSEQTQIHENLELRISPSVGKNQKAGKRDDFKLTGGGGMMEGGRGGRTGRKDGRTAGRLITRASNFHTLVPTPATSQVYLQTSRRAPTFLGSRATGQGGVHRSRSFPLHTTGPLHRLCGRPGGPLWSDFNFLPHPQPRQYFFWNIPPHFPMSVASYRSQ